MLIDEHTSDVLSAAASSSEPSLRIRQWREGLLDSLAPVASRFERVFIDTDAPDLSGLRHFTTVTWLAIRDGGTTIDFGSLPKLTKLHIWTKTAQFGNIGSARSLQQLHIISEQKDLSDLEAPPRLEELKIEETPLASLDGLQRFQSLRELKLSQMPLRSIDELGALPHLDVLGLNRLPQLKSVEPIKLLAGLRVLGLQGLPKVDDVSPVADLRSLQRLVLSGFPIRNGKLLEGLTELRFLVVERGGPIPSFRFVSSLSKLASADFSQTVADDGDVSVFTEHPALREIYFDNKSHYSSTLKAVRQALATKG